MNNLEEILEKLQKQIFSDYKKKTQKSRKLFNKLNKTMSVLYNQNLNDEEFNYKLKQIKYFSDTLIIKDFDRFQYIDCFIKKLKKNTKSFDIIKERLFKMMNDNDNILPPLKFINQLFI